MNCQYFSTTEYTSRVNKKLHLVWFYSKVEITVVGIFSQVIETNLLPILVSHQWIGLVVNLKSYLAFSDLVHRFVVNQVNSLLSQVVYNIRENLRHFKLKLLLFCICVTDRRLEKRGSFLGISNKSGNQKRLDLTGQSNFGTLTT
jgi:hypothetical protein